MGVAGGREGGFVGPRLSFESVFEVGYVGKPLMDKLTRREIENNIALLALFPLGKWRIAFQEQTVVVGCFLGLRILEKRRNT